MDTTAGSIAVTVLLFAGLLVCLEAGFRFGRWNVRRHPDTAYEGIGPFEGIVYALLGLLLAFSISGAPSRLDGRRQLIIQEANDIGTAYLRVDLLPAELQPEMRRLFRSYLDTRLALYERLSDETAAEQAFTRTAELQAEIWKAAVDGSRASPDKNTELLVLPAVNEMIDITTNRSIALNTHLPSLIVALIIGLALLSGLLAGYAMSKRKGRSWAHILLYAFLVSATFYVVIDLEYPRSGFIRLDNADRALYDLRDTIE